MSSKRRFRRERRSGISNLIGAIFFVLVVGLVIVALSTIFTTSSGYINGIHTSALQQGTAINSQVRVTNATFGGEVATAAIANPTGVKVNTTAAQLPMLPISNMNFSTGMQGWYVSESYPPLVDEATVRNSLPNGSAYIEQTTLSGMQSSNPETFTLWFANNATAGSHDDISRVTLLVDTDFDGISGVSCISVITCSGWNAPLVSGNNITLTAPGPAALVPGQVITYSWTADVPQTLGSYYHTAVVYWIKNLGILLNPPYFDAGITTVVTTIATPLPLPNLMAAKVTMVPNQASGNPGGLIAGYDGLTPASTSSSGPGSIYANYEPKTNGQPIASGQQQAGVTTFSTPFTLTTSNICALAVDFLPLPPPCASQPCLGCSMAASIRASLDEASSVPNSLVYYHLLLVNPSGTPYVINPGGTDLTTINHFGPSGWVAGEFHFVPPASFWVPGTYTFELVVNMTMPSGQPSEISMHFDDVGLALNLLPSGSVGASAFGEQVIPLSFGFSGTTTGAIATTLTDANANWKANQWVGDTLTYSTGPANKESRVITSNTATQITTPAFFPVPSLLGGDDFTVQVVGLIQGLSIGVNMSMSSVNSGGANPVLSDIVAYVYVQDQNVATVDGNLPASWTQVASVTFNGSATAQESFGLPNAAYYVGSSGEVDFKVLAVAPGYANACQAPVNCVLYTSAYAVAQTTSTNHLVLTMLGIQSAAPVHLVSLYVTGLNGYVNPVTFVPANSNGLANFAINNWLKAGTTVELALDLSGQQFAWIPGQTYSVSVTDSTGAIYSASFTAPSR